MLLVPLALTNRDKNVMSSVDNRYLAEFPAYGDKDFTTEFESYFSDRIGFRTEMMNAYIGVNYKVGGVFDHPLYMAGKKGHLFLNYSEIITYTDYHRKFALAVRQMQRYCEARGIKFYFMFEPEKLSSMRQYAPEGLNYDDSWADTMLAEMQSLGVNVISNKELLAEKSKTEKVYNTAYDAGHWNDLGCFYATNNLFSVMHKDFPAVTEMSEDIFDIGEKVEKYVAVSEYPINEKVPEYTLKYDINDVSRQYYTNLNIDSQFNHFHYYINTAPGAENLPKTIFFQGSYYNERKQFLINGASAGIGIHSYINVFDLDYYCNVFQPDAVVFEVAEYVFNDKYFPEDMLTGFTLPPAIITADSADAFAGEKAKLIEEAELDEGTGYAEILAGPEVDKLYLTGDFSDAVYMYVIGDDAVFDMKQNSEGQWESATFHGGVSAAEDPVIYYLDKRGKGHVVETIVRNMRRPVKVLTHSGNVSVRTAAKKQSKAPEMTYTLPAGDGNEFNAVILQIYNEEGYLSVARNQTKAGEAEGSYLHEGESGYYNVMLKANGSKRDEYIMASAYLEQGCRYYYSYDLESYSSSEIVIRAFDFYGYSEEPAGEKAEE